jgi:hypothetical protein
MVSFVDIPDIDGLMGVMAAVVAAVIVVISVHRGRSVIDIVRIGVRCRVQTEIHAADENGGAKHDRVMVAIDGRPYEVVARVHGVDVCRPPHTMVGPQPTVVGVVMPVAVVRRRIREGIPTDPNVSMA